MKRSESVLVYGVTGLLVVILVIAVAFGGGGSTSVDRVASGPEAAPPGLTELADLTDLIDPELVDPSATDATESVPPVPEQPFGPANVPLRVRDVHTVLGPHEVVEQFGASYRVVTVRQGDTLSQLVARWCGGTADLDVVRALNEGLEPERLRVGSTLWLPYVDDAELLAAFDSRRRGTESAWPAETGGGEPAATVREASSAPAPAVAVDGVSTAARNALRTPAVAVDSSAARTHVMREGESLWKLAVREVGANRARAYIDAIVELNRLPDPDRVRANTKLLLPSR